MSEWQPIETFPRDGNGYLVCDARTLDSHEVVFWDDEEKTGWCLHTSDGPSYHPATFTHWMPLPDMPGDQTTPGQP